MNLYCKRCQDKQALANFLNNLAYRPDVEIVEIITFQGQFTVNYQSPMEIW